MIVIITLHGFLMVRTFPKMSRYGSLSKAAWSLLLNPTGRALDNVCVQSILCSHGLDTCQIICHIICHMTRMQGLLSKQIETNRRVCISSDTYMVSAIKGTPNIFHKALTNTSSMLYPLSLLQNSSLTSCLTTLMACSFFWSNLIVSAVLCCVCCRTLKYLRLHFVMLFTSILLFDVAIIFLCLIAYFLCSCLVIFEAFILIE